MQSHYCLPIQSYHQPTLLLNVQLPYKSDAINYQSSWNKFIKQELALQSDSKENIGTLYTTSNLAIWY